MPQGKRFRLLLYWQHAGRSAPLPTELPLQNKKERQANRMIGLIVAYARNYVIGRDGRIPWDIPGELSRFKALTLGNAVVMGRRTYEEIGHPLPGRMNIIVSRTKNYTAENCFTVGSLAQAIAAAGNRDVFVSGGAALYREALPLVEKMFITEVELTVEGDTFFPDFDRALFEKTVEQHFDGAIPYTYVTYTKKGT